MRLIRLVVVASSSVLSVDDETKTIRKKHESSLLEVFSDVGSTPTASTIFYITDLCSPFHFVKGLRPVSSGRCISGIELSAFLFPHIRFIGRGLEETHAAIPAKDSVVVSCRT